MKKLLLFAIFLSSCTPHIEPTYQKYVDIFEKEAALHGKPIKVTTSIYTKRDLGDEILGRCIPIFSVIEISMAYWVDLSEPEREELLLHEISHCELKRYFHNEELDEKGIPLSIMYPSLIPGYVYLYYRDKYMEELFK